MSHWAEIDDNNFVMRVLVGENTDDDGKAFFDALGGRWIQTSYNAKIRKNFAATGFYYDEDLDAFIPPKPLPSHILDEETCQWVAPVAYPKDGNRYIWNEETLSWDLTDETKTF